MKRPLILFVLIAFSLSAFSQAKSKKKSKTRRATVSQQKPAVKSRFDLKISGWEESKEGLYIELYKDNAYIAGATGFVIKSPKQNYLVTNYHVITNKTTEGDWNEGTPHIKPNRIAIFHHAKEEGKYVVKYENLSGKKGQRWIPWKLYADEKSKRVITGDVVFLPLSDTADINFYPVDYTNLHQFEAGEQLVISSYPSDIITYLPPAPAPTPKGPLEGTVQLNRQKNPISFLYVDPAKTFSFKGLSGSPTFLDETAAVASTDSTAASPPATRKFGGVFSASGFNRVSIVPAQSLQKVMGRLP